MSIEFLPLTETEKQRNTWFKFHARPGMKFDEFIQLNDEALRLFPQTEEERQQKTKSLIAMPEFAL
jgi:hypothetical protein